ncbi:hypothetical protein D3C71_2057940 [compost metagenome]
MAAMENRLMAFATCLDSITEASALSSTSTSPPWAMTGPNSLRGRLPKMLSSHSR